MLESLFNKVARLHACNLIKKRLQHSCFPLNIAKLVKTAFFYRTPLVATFFDLNTGYENLSAEANPLLRFVTKP